MNLNKCPWFEDGGLLERYHDEEWGQPCHDDRLLYEYLMLECLSAGLSWKLMLQKRSVFRECLAGFDFERLASFDETDIAAALAFPGMIRSRRKIEAIVGNARCYRQIRSEWGSFDRYIWSFTEGRTVIYQTHLDGGWKTVSTLSETIAGDLRRRGFKYLGPTLVYSYLQSVGVVNDHEPDCYLFGQVGGDVVPE